MKKIQILRLLVAVALFMGFAQAFEYSQPEAQGVSSTAILGWVEAVDRDVDSLHSFVLLRHGKIIAEAYWVPYEKDRPHLLYSLSKSFTSTAVGLAVDEGRLSLDDKVISFFPKQTPEKVSEHLANMRVRDLLCMGTGNECDTFVPMIKDGAETDWIKLFLAQPVKHEPGTFFCYNTGATYMLSAIVQQVTGQKVADYLTPRLFKPLNIKNPAWETSAQGITTGGYGLKIKTRDIAAFGQLYLQKGQWKGRRILSEKWVEAAISKQISNGNNPRSDWNQGYGYQFWRCRHNAFRGDGAFGQYCVVMPDQDVVLAIHGGMGDMQRLLDRVWTLLLPGIHPHPLPSDTVAQARLVEKLGKLALHTVKGDAISPVDATVIGKTYTFDNNEKGLQSLSLNRDDEGLYLMIRNVHGEQRVDCGYGSWVNGELTFEKNLKQPIDTTNGRQVVAASGAWSAPDLFVADVVFRETPYKLTLSLRFKEDRLMLDLVYNVSFGKRKWTLSGRP